MILDRSPFKLFRGDLYYYNKGGLPRMTLGTGYAYPVGLTRNKHISLFRQLTGTHYFLHQSILNLIENFVMCLIHDLQI